jgi:MoxR-like ATPase
MNDDERMYALQLAHSLRSEILEPMKRSFVGKDEIIDLLGLCLVARENLFLLGPPGTAKSALVQELARRIDGRVFDYLLTRFTEPNEIFGPFDIRKLREGELETNTEGMLPDADFIFLDELLNANSAILNSLLLVLNERIFRRGRETRPLGTLMVVGASNRLPEDEALGALFDRFLVRVGCHNVAEAELPHVLSAGWELETRPAVPSNRLHVDQLRQLSRLVAHVDVSQLRAEYSELVGRLRRAGLVISDRRAVKLQRLIAASAVLCGRLQANRTDFWVLRYMWDAEDEQDILAALIDKALQAATDQEKQVSHPRSQVGEAPDPERIAADLQQIAGELGQVDTASPEFSVLKDRLGLLAARTQWVTNAQQRNHLEKLTNELWNSVGAKR